MAVTDCPSARAEHRVLHAHLTAESSTPSKITARSSARISGSWTSADPANAATSPGYDVTRAPMFAHLNVRYALTTCAGLTATCQTDRCPAWLAARAEYPLLRGRVLIEIQPMCAHSGGRVRVAQAED